jgi:hypothetical protein
MNLDTAMWKEFIVSDLFDVSVSRDSNLFNSNIGQTPFVASSSANNGVTGYIDVVPSQKANTITIARNGSVGSTFYQPIDYCASPDDIRILTPKFTLNPYIGLFLSTIIQQERFKYSYGRKLSSARIKKLIIKLPVDNKGFPNWRFMEQYIKKMHHKPISTKILPDELPVLETKKWGEYRIGELFKIERCKNSSSANLVNGNDCYYLGAKKSENGVMRRVVRDDSVITKGNCIIFIGNGQGSVGYANYMNNDFIGTADLTVGYNENLNQYVGLFIVTLLDLERPKYSFGRKWSARIADTVIKLPQTRKGTPDWSYMENYIKSLPYGDRV